jgi:hypothetical protein
VLLSAGMGVFLAWKAEKAACDAIKTAWFIYFKNINITDLKIMLN